MARCAPAASSVVSRRGSRASRSGKKADFTLTLTEFPDPDGKATYFRLRDFSAAVDDELFSAKAK